MVIHNFDLVSIAPAPAEADAPLPVNTDAVLALSLALQGFQSISWGNAQVLQADSGIEKPELVQGRFLQLRRQSARELPVPDFFCFLIGKARYHDVEYISICNTWQGPNLLH